MNKVKFLIGTLMSAVVLMGCSKEVEDKGPEPPPNPYTSVIFEFTHNVDGATFIPDTAQYLNGSNNIWGATNLQYLVGKIRLKSWNNPDHIFIDEYHMVDLKDASTHVFRPKDSILIDDYNDVTLFMGFEEKKNITGEYPDLNNAGFGWPANYGGGYYTLKMLGNYYSNASSTVTNPYNLAIGGYKLKETPSDTSYVPNDEIYPNLTSGFAIPKGTKLVRVEVRMDLNKLFKDNFGNPNYNLDVFQTNIEQDAIATEILSRNLGYCFRLGSVTFDEEAENSTP